MELQEAISHARGVAAGNHPGIDGCSECAKEHAQLADWLDELQIYRQLREQGLLVRVPCKVGDTVWVAVKGVRVKEVVECVVDEISIDSYAPFAVLRRKSALGRRWHSYYIECFGKSVFLTREEAEAALAKENYQK